MRALDAVIDNIDFPHRSAAGKPLATLENVERLVDEFGAVVARPRLNSEQPVPFFPGRYNATSPELQRDAQLSKLADIARRHGIEINVKTVARYMRLLHVEREELARIAENEKLLKRGLA